jgi:hypothetical protein
MDMRRLLVVLILAAGCSTAVRERANESPSTSPPVRSAGRTPIETAPPDAFALAREGESKDPDELVDRVRRAQDLDPADRGRVEQPAFRQLARTPEWRSRVLDGLPPGVARRVAANVEAGVELRLLTPPKTGLPPWRIVPPPPTEELKRAYTDAQQASGIGWEYLAAIHLVETRMGRIRGTSDAGAKGPMQFLPSTWARWGKGDIEDPHDAIRAAARYLVASGGPHDMQRALFAYNHSDHYVRAVSIYAEQMRKQPRDYEAYHAWQVYYRTTKGDALLYEGWPTR